MKRSRVLTSEATARQSPVKGFKITPPGGGLEERRKSHKIFSLQEYWESEGKAKYSFSTFQLAEEWWLQVPDKASHQLPGPPGKVIFTPPAPSFAAYYYSAMLQSNKRLWHESQYKQANSPPTPLPRAQDRTYWCLIPKNVRIWVKWVYHLR